MRIQIGFTTIITIIIQSFLSANTSYANTVYQHDDYCKKVDGIYAVNSFGKPSFVTNDPLGELKQVIKKGSYLFISEISRYNRAQTEFSFWIGLYVYNCNDRTLNIASSLEIAPPSNYTVSSPEIDMIDSNYIIVRAYSTYTDGYEFIYYDRRQKKDFTMGDATNAIENFNTILDYKPGRNGKGRVLVRFANMSKKWMSYDLSAKKIY